MAWLKMGVMLNTQVHHYSKNGGYYKSFGGQITVSRWSVNIKHIIALRVLYARDKQTGQFFNI